MNHLSPDHPAVAFIRAFRELHGNAPPPGRPAERMARAIRLPDYFGTLSNPLQRSEEFDRLAVCGPWGDVICAMGEAQRIMAAAGKDTCPVVHLGKDPAIAEFIACQPAFRQCRSIQVPDAEYMLLLYHAGYPTAEGIERVKGLFLEWGVDIERTAFAGIDFYDGTTPVNHWHHASLPEDTRQWAREIVSRYRLDMLVQPLSLNTSVAKEHWPHWREAIAWLKAQGRRIALCGKGWDSTDLVRDTTGIVDLVNRTDSQMQVMALAELIPVVTTSNSLAHWCVVQEQTAVVCCTESVSYPKNFFRSWLHSPDVLMVEFQESLERFQQLCRSLSCSFPEPVAKRGVASPAVP